MNKSASGVKEFTIGGIASLIRIYTPLGETRS